MSVVYEHCPAFENERYLFRFARIEDAEELVRVYSDKNALPFFNSDNCHGDNFYYPTVERMREAITFWLQSYTSGWFVRWTIIDKSNGQAIGSAELFHRVAEDAFNHAVVLRLDVGSDYERAEILASLLGLIVPQACELFDSNEVITKVPLYAVERRAAAERTGFTPTDRLLVGTMDGYAYKDYWFRRKS